MVFDGLCDFEVGGPFGIGGLKLGHIGRLRFGGISGVKLAPKLFGGSILGSGNPLDEQWSEFNEIPNVQLL